MSFSLKQFIQNHVVLLAKGVAMGAADIVPGVSGGTMAFLLGIYEELITSIRSISSPTFITSLLRFNIPAAWKVMNGNFLASVGCGVLLAIFLLAHVLEFLLGEYPVYVWSFFFGLIIASAWVVRTRIKQWNVPVWIALLLGAFCGYSVVGLPLLHTPDTLPYMFLSGAIAICAMILPGISGSFILVILGKYQAVLQAITEFDVLTLAAVSVGCVVGLLLFSHILYWLLHRFYSVTIAFLIGLMLGSLRKVWPWKETLETMVDRHGELVPVVEQNVLPSSVSLEVGVAATCAVIGFVAVLLISKQTKS